MPTDVSMGQSQSMAGPAAGASRLHPDHQTRLVGWCISNSWRVTKENDDGQSKNTQR